MTSSHPSADPAATTITPTTPGLADVDRLIAQSLPHVVAIRRDIHAHPEMAYREHRTHDLIVRELGAMNIAYVPNLAGGTGVLAHLPATNTDASAPSNRTAIAFRADIDALPIAENTGVAYASTTPGTMHACGHDGHAATLLGLARVLSAVKHRPNPVTLIFQPAEEGGAGGRKMCEDGVLNGSRLGPPVSHIYALHGWPDLPLGHVASRHGPFLAATDTFEINVTGKQGHAAMPHFAKDPIVAIAHIVTALQTLVSRSISPLSSAVVTVGQLNAGTAVNIIPTSAHARGTLRTFDPQIRAALKKRLSELVASVAAGLGCTAQAVWHDGYPVTHNEQAATDHFYATARAAFGESRVDTFPEPFMGGEDFAFYGKHVPACFFVLGLNPPTNAEGAYPKLHTPEFDFNDEAIPTGIAAFAALALAQRPATG